MMAMKGFLKTEKVFTILELNNTIKKIINYEFAEYVWVCGEIQDLRTWFMVRKQALNGINNLHESLKKTMEESKSVEEIKDSIRMFSFSAQEDFVHNLMRLEKLWNRKLLNVTTAMNRVLSIMLVTQEKIGRYKSQLELDEQDLSNLLERILHSLLEDDLSNFNDIEKKFRNNIIHGE